MIQKMLYSLIVFGLTCSTIKASDNECDRIVPLDYAKHGKETLAIIKSNLSKLSHMPNDPAAYKQEEERLVTKYDACMHNNMHMSSIAKIVAGTVHRCVLIGGPEKCVLGVVCFFQRAPVEQHYPSTWYIEELSIKEGQSKHAMRNLARYARSVAVQKGACVVITHALPSDQCGQEALLEADFVELDETELERTYKQKVFGWTAQTNT